MDVDAVATAGDRVVYALESTDGSSCRHWLLELSLPEPPRLRHLLEARGPDPVSGFARTTAASWQGDGRNDFMRYVTYGDVQVRVAREDSHEVLTQRVQGQVQLHVWQQSVLVIPRFGVDFLFEMLLHVDGLLDELVSVVQTPSIASVIANGMKVHLDLRFDDAAQPELATVDTPFGPLPAFWLPVRLLANDQPALEGRLLLTWRRSPLLLSYGLLRIEAHHPADPRRTVTARLVGAERGVPDQVIDRADLGRGLRVGMSEAELLAGLDGTPTNRYRVHLPDGTPVELLAFECPRMSNGVGAFVDGKLWYCSAGGGVSMFLEHRGMREPPYKPENLVR